MAVKRETSENLRLRVKEPSKYNIRMHNDDFTTMEFVVEVLMTFFNKSNAEANRLMLLVHQKGSAIIACYPYDIAATKVKIVMAKARDEGFPFRVTLEEA